MRKLVISTMYLESFRFEDKNEYRYDITFKVFARVVTKKRLPGKLHFPFFFVTKKLVRLFILKGVKPSLDSKMIKFLTFDNIFPPLRHSRENS